MEGQTDETFRYHVFRLPQKKLAESEKMSKGNFVFCFVFNHKIFFIIFCLVLLLILKHTDFGILLPLKIFILIINMWHTFLAFETLACY